MFSNTIFARSNYETRKKIKNTKKELRRPYTHDRLVAALSLGFWVKLFDKLQFRVGDKTLHKIFVNRPHGINQKTIYKSLVKIRDFRNRIAHLEPICFNRLHKKDLSYAEDHYKIILSITQEVRKNSS